MVCLLPLTLVPVVYTWTSFREKAIRSALKSLNETHHEKGVVWSFVRDDKGVESVSRLPAVCCWVVPDRSFQITVAVMVSSS